jgi:hypothetical protein
MLFERTKDFENDKRGGADVNPQRKTPAKINTNAKTANASKTNGPCSAILSDAWSISSKSIKFSRLASAASQIRVPERSK